MTAAASRWLALAPLLGSGCGVCASIGEPVDLGIVDDDRVEEASGLAWGGAAWWAHNDTDETPALYAIDGQARVVAQVRMLAVSPVDVEDIAARYEGGAPVELLIGDIGDNDGDRDEIVLLRAPTPAVESGDLRVERVVWTYDDGEARDAEALLVDPTDGAPYVITQEADGGQSGQVIVYGIPSMRIL
ncbi:MAG TPA: hypothetical protein PKA64_01115, partial [Myxococcota bacterium]|nr:hypothetical protein [Myxococcota bacterium]